MSDFRFAEPGWALMLWGVLAFTGLLLWLDARSGTALARFLSRELGMDLAAVGTPYLHRELMREELAMLPAGTVLASRPMAPLVGAAPWRR